MRLKKFNELFDSEELRNSIGSYNVSDLEIDDFSDKNIAFSNWLMFEFPFFSKGRPAYKDSSQIYSFVNSDSAVTIMFYVKSKIDIQMFVTIKHLDTGDLKRYDKRFYSSKELAGFIRTTLNKELAECGFNSAVIQNPSIN